MSFTSKNLHTRGGMGLIKWATLFFLGMSCVLFMTQAFNISPIQRNIQTLVNKILLTVDGNPGSATGAYIDGTSGNAYFKGDVTVDQTGTLWEVRLQSVRNRLFLDSNGDLNIAAFHNMVLDAGAGYNIELMKGWDRTIKVQEASSTKGDNLTIAAGKWDRIPFAGWDLRLKGWDGGTDPCIGMCVIFSNWGNIYVDGWAGTWGGDHGNVLLANSWGNVGIGIANPTHKLEVTNNAKISIDEEDQAVVVEDWANGTNALEIGNGTDLKILLDSTNAGYRVGIGTSTPGYTLDVNGSTAIRGNLWVGTNATTRPLYVSGTAVFMNGNVGIGNTSPSEKLTVNGNIFFPSIDYAWTKRTISVGQNSYDNPWVGLSINAGQAMSDDGEWYEWWSLRLWAWSGAGTSSPSDWGNVYINWGNWANLGDVILANSRWNVGIGTTSPVAKLHVVGRGKFTNSVQVGSPETNRCNVSSDAGKMIYEVWCIWGAAQQAWLFICMQSWSMTTVTEVLITSWWAIGGWLPCITPL